MNAITSNVDRVDPQEWERSDMRAALAVRDISRVYRLLQRIGFSQQRIAALTGQSQPEVSAILHGRKVMAYDVLSRIADGLGIPRAYMGLSYGGETSGPADGASAGASTGVGAPEPLEEDDPVHRRDFITSAAAAAVGATAPRISRLAATWAPVALPAHIGATEIAQLRAMTQRLSEVDREYGGVAVLDAIAGYQRFATGLLGATCNDATRRQLLVALADLHSLAAWSLHDGGRHAEARKQFLHGIALAREAGDDGMVAALLYLTGRINLHHGQAAEALHMLQLGRAAAMDARSHGELGCLYANEAWAYGILGRPRQVADALARAEHERGLCDPDAERVGEPALARLRDDPDQLKHGVAGIAGLAYLQLSCHGNASDSEASAGRAVHALIPVVNGGRPGRPAVLDQTVLAASLLRAGDRPAGIAAAHAALDKLRTVRSTRATDRLAYIAEATSPWPRQQDITDLRKRIATIRAA